MMILVMILNDYDDDFNDLMTIWTRNMMIKTTHLMTNQVSDVVNVIFDHGWSLEAETPGNYIHILCKIKLSSTVS